MRNWDVMAQLSINLTDSSYSSQCVWFKGKCPVSLNVYRVFTRLVRLGFMYTILKVQLTNFLNGTFLFEFVGVSFACAHCLIISLKILLEVKLYSNNRR